MGGKTHVVSLPSDWVRRYEVQKGEELELETIDNTIIISTDKKQKKKSIETNFSTLNLMLNRSVGAIYKAGYDEAKIIFSGKDQIKEIEKVLMRTCIGFEIIEQAESYIRLRNVADVDPTSFDNSLKRLFYTIEVMGDLFCQASSKKDYQSIIAKDDQVNKIADFCRRVLNKGENRHISKPHVTYYIVEQLERIGDVYKKIAKLCIEEKISRTNELIKICKEVLALFILYRHIYYDFNLEKIENFGTSFKVLQNKIKDLPTSPLLIYQEMLAEHIYDMNGALLTSKI
jgi:phosphate uptake regulator